MRLSKIASLHELYQQEGIKSTFRQVWKYLLLESKASPYLKKALPDVWYQKLLAYPYIGYWPQIQNPKSFNEKLLHRKLFTNKELFSVVEDKWQARAYVDERVSEDILPELYLITDDPNTICFDDLPTSFVIKPTHLSGPIKIIDNKNSENINSIKNTCELWLSQQHGELRNEYWTKNIKPKILIEERLKDQEHDIPLDFKFFVFHGRVEYIQVDFDRFSEHKRRLYDRKWEPQGFSLKYPLGPKINEPEQLDKMIHIAETLGSEFDFIRVDLYQPNGDRVVFGELTVAHGSGYERFDPKKYDFEVGSLW